MKISLNQHVDQNLLPPAQFLSGHHTITRSDKKIVLAQVKQTTIKDSQEIQKWYEQDTSDQPTYADDPTWKQWWLNAINQTQESLHTYKLTITDEFGKELLLGVLALKVIEDWNDRHIPTLYINGLRINPNIMPSEHEKRRFHGVGAALITFAIIESVKKDLSGITLNSSLGVEIFYRNLGLHESQAHDGKRSYFTLKGTSRAKYIEQQYQKSLEYLG